MSLTNFKRATGALGIYLIICWAVTASQIFFFPAPRMLLLFLFLPVGGIAAIVYFVYYVVVWRRWIAAAVAVGAIALLVLNIYTTFQPLEKYDLLKYQMARDSYHQAAQIVLEDLEDEPDTLGYEQYEKDDRIRGFPGRNDIMYIKFKGNILIYFVTSNSSSTMTGYVYYSGANILDYVEDPLFYLPDGPMYSRRFQKSIQLNDPNWMYVIWC